MVSDSPEEERVPRVDDTLRETIVVTVRDAEGPLDVEELADRLARHDAGLLEAAEFEDEVDRAKLALHHNHLPKLDEAGLVDYDRATNVVTARPAPAASVDWHDVPTATELIADLRADPDGDAGDIGFLEGREAIIRYGRRLADEADEELFCMYVDTDLLEEECVRHARDAIGRGVEMYVGSRNESVRDLTRARLPQATIWEPQLDWLNTPTYPRVGRLVLADRREVMLAVLDEPPGEAAHPEEAAVVGEGEDNPLVVLVRELLGSRLDHLDYQSTDFRSELST